MLFLEHVRQNSLCITWLYCPRNVTKEEILNHHRTRETHGSHFRIWSFKLILYLGLNKRELKRLQRNILEKFTRQTNHWWNGRPWGKWLPLQYWSLGGANVVFYPATSMRSPLQSRLLLRNVCLLFVLSNFEQLKDLK